MEKSYSDSYKAAGVDVTAGYAAVELMKKHVARTHTPGVLSGLGGFGGLFAPDLAGMGEPVLVSGTDGVGTKLQVAQLLGRHDTIGIDCVAMCVNDIVCAGARPLFFLDYLAVGKNIPAQVEQIVAGVAEGCVQAGCALIGGETAEHPGVMEPEEYDIAGFAVGMVDKSKLLDAQRVRPGDVLLALPSSGVHSNGFSLVRKVFGIGAGGDLNAYADRLGAPLGETLLTPTQIYVKPLLALLEQVEVHAACHITGGGFYENLPRALGEGNTAVLQKERIQTPPIFGLIAEVGGIPERDMFNTFNMGVGMCVALPPEEAEKGIALLKAQGIQAYPMGEVASGNGGVELR